MKKTIYIFITLLFSLSIVGQIKTDEKQRDLEFYNAINKWFSALKLVNKDIYKIDKVKPVDFLVFDDKYVYSTSNSQSARTLLRKNNYDSSIYKTY